ncbi:MAG TPA: aldehyde dehydrogenase family protein, partial [Gryllotalpicola sp.]
MTRELRNFISGEYVEQSGDDRLDIINPATAQVFATSPRSTDADVHRAFEAAAAAFEEWSEATPSERQLALFRFAD